MLKQVYIFIWLACTQMTYAQQHHFFQPNYTLTNSAGIPPFQVNEGREASSVNWRLHHYIDYNATNSQWVLSDSFNYIYADAFTGNEYGWPSTDRYVSVWNTPQQLYVNSSHEVYQFNAQGKQTSQTQIMWNGTQWQNQYKNEYTYDGAGNNTQYSYFVWFANNWYEIQRGTYSYSLQGYITDQTYMDTTGGGGLLVNRSKNIYTRDGANRIIATTEQTWSNSAWVNYRYNTTYYTGSSTKQDSVYYYNWTNNSWGTATQKQIYTYGLGGFIMQELGKYYSNNAWINSSKTDYTYDVNGNQTSMSRYYWTNNAWVYSDKYIMSYSPTNKETETIQLDYNNQTQQLVNYYRQTTSYNINDLPDQYITYNWANSAWDIYRRSDVFYEELQNNSIANMDGDVAAKAFPNPFKVNTLIQFNSKESGNTQISITDLTGKEVFRQNQCAQTGANSFLWQAEDDNGQPLPAGMYVVSVKGKTTSAFSKIIKQ